MIIEKLPYLKVQGIKKVHEYIGKKYTAIQVGILYADGKPITTVAFDEIDISSQDKPMVRYKGALIMIVDEVEGILKLKLRRKSNVRTYS